MVIGTRLFKSLYCFPPYAISNSSIILAITVVVDTEVAIDVMTVITGGPQGARLTKVAMAIHLADPLMLAGQGGIRSFSVLALEQIT
ncbi:hypothetical protein Ancab_006997 [Ancistrocladus abbreviatus]